jgi:hypothetical protein
MLINDDEVFQQWLASSSYPIDPEPLGGVDHPASVHPPIEAVWALIAPAVPDVLHEIRTGVYEAVWWTPIPHMDIEMLLHTDGIVIIGHAFEPVGLPKGRAVWFSIAPHDGYPIG